MNQKERKKLSKNEWAKKKTCIRNKKERNEYGKDERKKKW